jgi:hypothetical protein
MVFKLWSYEFESRGSLTMRKIQGLFFGIAFFHPAFTYKSCQEIFAKGGPNSGKPVLETTLILNLGSSGHGSL